jgi:hypothetical protein
VTLDGLGEPPVLLLLALLVEFLGVLLRVVQQLVVVVFGGNAVGYLQVVILDDEAAPGEVEVRLTIEDPLAELLPDRVDDEEHLLLVGLEVLVLPLGEDEVLAHSDLLHLNDEHNDCD